jgi:hypothetical protein
MCAAVIGLPRLATVTVTVMFCLAESNVTVALPNPGLVVGGTSPAAVRTAPSVCPNAAAVVSERIERATSRVWDRIGFSSFFALSRIPQGIY